MKHRRLNEEFEKIALVQAAKEAFDKDPKLATFSIGDVVEGSLFAVRWGLDNDCIMILKIDESTEPEIFVGSCDVLRKRKPI